MAPHIADELPGLGIAWLEVAARPGRSPEPVRLRLRGLSDRFYGAHAIHMREQPIPGPTGSSSARSGSTRIAPVLRSSSWRWTGFTTAPLFPTACPTTR